MIEIQCSCGAEFEVLNEQVAQRVRCPRCGAKASDLIAGAGGAPAEEAQPAQFQVPCGVHPDRIATHNCMNCGKPLCMDCVRERGYYCSDVCRDAVKAAEPDAATGDSREMGASLERMERSMERLGGWLKKLGGVAVIAGIGYIGFVVYQRVTAPKGQVTSAIMNPALVEAFRVKLLQPDLVVVAANDELSLVQLSSGQKQWTVSLPTLEEKVTPPKRVADSSEELPMGDIEYRDALRFGEVHGDHILVYSSRQIIDFDSKTGSVRWKFFDPKASIRDLVVHDDGVWCALDYSQRFVNLSLADGATTCTYSNQGVMQSACVGSRVALVSQVFKAQTPRDEESEVLTAGSANPIDVRALMATAQGKPAPAPRAPAADYRVTFVTPTDGRVVAEESLSVSGFPKVEALGNLLVMIGDQELVVFGDDGKLKWKATMPAEPQEVAHGSDLLVVTSEQGVVAFDANSGQQKWTRTGLKAGNVVIGPDSGVYVTISLTKAEIQQGEAEKYRIADIVRGGMGMPLPPFRALVKLDPRTGKTRWGIRNIGDKVFFDGDKVFVVDELEQTNFLANQIMVGGHSVRCLSARNGKELWSYVKTGDLYHSEVAGSKVFIVISEDPPSGRQRASCNYQLQLVEAK
ncbi:MAG TPA: PQQ-binding-like beta-propeller repeat protein [Verrucomicrobiae bacterium]|nr:PQQ-binding-like beta-propeller repeat protein [Verrucomicrobiae bacterium]